MELFGIGGMELAAILIIMLVVAGPKRMAQWAFILGQYVAKLRSAWKTVSAELQQDIDAAGLDVTLPRDLPTRQNLNASLRRQMNRAAAPVMQPLTETLEQPRTHPTGPTAGEPAANTDRLPQPTVQHGEAVH